MVGGWVWMTGLFCLTAGSPQSNYDQQALSAKVDGIGLNEFATLNGTVTELGT